MHRPRPDGRVPTGLDWAWTDSTSEWSWDVTADTPMTVDVYSDAEEVELRLNDTVIGRRPCGREHGYLASFTVPYAHGELTAVNRRHREPAESMTIRSCGPVAQVQVRIEEQVGGPPSDYTYVAVELIDVHGSVVPFDDRVVRVTVNGGLRLSGLGSARPATEESYLDDTCHTYLGRAQAIVRSTTSAVGEIVVQVDGLPEVRVTI